MSVASTNKEVIKLQKQIKSLSNGIPAFTGVGYSQTGHGHNINDVSGLQAALNDKQNNLIAGDNIIINGTTISATGGGGGGSTDWASITGKPTTFAPSSHNNHIISDVSGLQAALNDKQNTLIAGTNIVITNGNTISATGGGGGSTAWIDITGKPTTFDPTGHTHLWADITDKPTSFQADWSTTIINKPTIFNGDYNNLSNRPANFPADWNTTIANRPTIFDGNYNNLSNKPALFSGSFNNLTDVPTQITNIEMELYTKATQYTLIMTEWVSGFGSVLWYFGSMMPARGGFYMMYICDYKQNNQNIHWMGHILLLAGGDVSKLSNFIFAENITCVKEGTGIRITNDNGGGVKYRIIMTFLGIDDYEP